MEEQMACHNTAGGGKDESKPEQHQRQKALPMPKPPGCLLKPAEHAIDQSCDNCRIELYPIPPKESSEETINILETVGDNKPPFSLWEKGGLCRIIW
jgi:hypothetical protein